MIAAVAIVPSWPKVDTSDISVPFSMLFIRLLDSVSINVTGASMTADANGRAGATCTTLLNRLIFSLKIVISQRHHGAAQTTICRRSYLGRSGLHRRRSELNKTLLYDCASLNSQRRHNKKTISQLTTRSNPHHHVRHPAHFITTLLRRHFLDNYYIINSFRKVNEFK